MEDDCQLESVIFTATKSLFVYGSSAPALEGADITLESGQLDQAVTIPTDQKGTYSLGASPRDIEFTVKADKLGYGITETTTGSCPNKKLASVLVRISDGSRNQVVGLVVSGGESNYRTNEMSTLGLSFLALSPGLGSTLSSLCLKNTSLSSRAS